MRPACCRRLGRRCRLLFVRICGGGRWACRCFGCWLGSFCPCRRLRGRESRGRCRECGPSLRRRRRLLFCRWRGRFWSCGSRWGLRRRCGCLEGETRASSMSSTRRTFFCEAGRLSFSASHLYSGVKSKFVKWAVMGMVWVRVSSLVYQSLPLSSWRIWRQVFARGGGMRSPL
jgi:hypothetical protein